MKHFVYLYTQKIKNQSDRIARWSPTVDRRYINPFEKKTKRANEYLKKYNYPELSEDPNTPPLLPEPYEIIEIDDNWLKEQKERWKKNVKFFK